MTSELFTKAVFATGGAMIAQIPTEYLSIIDKGGLVAVLVIVCWLLWMRDEKRNSEFAHLLERFLQGQATTNEELKKQSKILEERRSNEKS